MSVILYPTDVTMIRTVQDCLSNMLATSTGTWTQELKFYRPNPASTREGPVEPIYTISTNQNKNVSLFTKDEAVVCDNGLQQILQSKLKSLWIARQTFRIEGEAYQLDDLEIRVGNAFLSGNFKGLVVELWGEQDNLEEKILAVVARLGIDAPTEFCGSRLEMERQYSKLNK